MMETPLFHLPFYLTLLLRHKCGFLPITDALSLLSLLFMALHFATAWFLAFSTSLPINDVNWTSRRFWNIGNDRRLFWTSALRIKPILWM